MNFAECLSHMVLPGQRRPGKPRGGVIQIWVTRACDKACFGCTQGSNLKGRCAMITCEHFEQACISLRDYWGTVGVFGGNPALHPQFEQLCAILCKYIPKRQRGLWCNAPMGKASVMRETFDTAISNLNVHLDQQAYDEFKRDWPECRPFGLHDDCRHGPPFVAMQDVIENEEQIWQLVADCDINQHWSAMICEVAGQPRAYFCEIAGAQAILHQEDSAWPDLGLAVEPSWWNKPMLAYQHQVRYYCPRCGVPLRGLGELAQASDGVEQTSRVHQNVFKPKVAGREIEVVDHLEQVLPQTLPRFTNYMTNVDC